MDIVKAAKEHLKELMSLQRKYMEHHVKVDEYFAFKENMGQLWMEHMEEFIESEDKIVFIAVENSQIVGYMTGSIVKRAPIYRVEKVGRIGDAFVLPEFRRKGIFTRLLDETLRWMKGRGVKIVEHPVAVKNKLGRIAWKKRGFEDFIVFTKRRL